MAYSKIDRSLEITASNCVVSYITDADQMPCAIVVEALNTAEKKNELVRLDILTLLDNNRGVQVQGLLWENWEHHTLLEKLGGISVVSWERNAQEVKAAYRTNHSPQLAEVQEVERSQAAPRIWENFLVNNLGCQLTPQSSLVLPVHQRLYIIGATVVTALLIVLGSIHSIPSVTLLGLSIYYCGAIIIAGALLLGIAIKVGKHCLSLPQNAPKGMPYETQEESAKHLLDSQTALQVPESIRVSLENQGKSADWRAQIEADELPYLAAMAPPPIPLTPERASQIAANIKQAAAEYAEEYAEDNADRIAAQQSFSICSIL